MRWDPNTFTEDLKAAADAYDRREVETLCSRLLEELRTRTKPYPEEAAKNDLATLRKKRWFDLMSQVADAHLRTGMNSPQIRRQYAQAMLDRGDVTGALPILREIQSQEDISVGEHAEAVGLIGRAHKQIYMDAQCGRGGRARHYQRALLTAFDAYNEIYEQDHEKYLWQGINAASLLARAERDDIDAGDRPPALQLAEQVRDAVNEKKRSGNASMWDLACLAEAHVALALLRDRDAARTEWERAAHTLKEYVEHDWANAFELASTLRQYEQVWQLDKDESEEAVLLDMLRAELLKHSGGGMVADPAKLRAAAENATQREGKLEALLGSDKYKSHTWLNRMLRRAQGVARIWKGTRGIGSGFLVPGGILSDRWADHDVLVTNNHVIATEPRLSITIPPKKAEITFDALHELGPDQPRFKVAEVLEESLFDELDFTIMRLDKAVDGIEDYPAIDDEDLPSVEEKARIYVIGHPLGGELSYSIQDNKILGMNEQFIHYRSPTEKGSSGSPLFDEEWNLIGLHHAGSKYMERLDDPDETYEANEGIPLPAIRSAINEPETAKI